MIGDFAALVRRRQHHGSSERKGRIPLCRPGAKDDAAERVRHEMNFRSGLQFQFRQRGV